MRGVYRDVPDLDNGDTDASPFPSQRVLLGPEPEGLPLSTTDVAHDPNLRFRCRFAVNGMSVCGVRWVLLWGGSAEGGSEVPAGKPRGQS